MSWAFFVVNYAVFTWWQISAQKLVDCLSGRFYRAWANCDLILFDGKVFDKRTQLSIKPQKVLNPHKFELVALSFMW